MYNVLNETNDYYIGYSSKQIFNIDVKNNYITPYNFDNYFKKDISYNVFTNLCLHLTKSSILEKEIYYLKKYYSKKKIKNKYKLIDIINNKNTNKNNVELINILIITKRFEYLLEYLEKINMNSNYINYIKQHLKSLYNSTKILIKIY